MRQRFSELQNEDEGRILWHVIDAAQSVEAVTNDIVNIVNKVMEGVAQGKPLQKLWSDGVYDLARIEDGQGVSP